MNSPLLQEFIRSVLLLLMLLNPFLLIIYLIDLMQELDDRSFSQVLVRAGIISRARPSPRPGSLLAPSGIR